MKERIIDQAGTLFYAYGIKNVSMDSIAAALGISKRTLYETFKDKEDVLKSYLISLSEKKKAHIEMLRHECTNIIEVFLHVIEYHKNNDMPSVKFYEDIVKYYPSVHKMITLEIENNKIYIKEFLQEGIKGGYIRANLNVDATAFLVEESNYTFIRASYIEKPSFSFQELFFTMMINFIRGISTYKGIEIVDNYLTTNSIEN